MVKYTMNIYEEEPLITEELWRRGGNSTKKCRSVETEARVFCEQKKKSARLNHYLWQALNGL